jgi:hypothetical protein
VNFVAGLHRFRSHRLGHRRSGKVTLLTSRPSFYLHLAGHHDNLSLVVVVVCISVSGIDGVRR